MNEYPEEVQVTEIGQLSDKELRRIFLHLSLLDLLAVGLVCKRWNAIHRKLCTEQTSLVLYVPENRRDRIWTDVRALWYRDSVLFQRRQTFHYIALPIHNYLLNTRECNQLKSKFPQIRSLHLFGVVFSFESFKSLLENWPRLESLSVICDDFADGTTWSPHSIWNRVWKLYDSLLNLKHLALPFDFRLDKFYTSPTLQRLESLQIPIGPDTDCGQLCSLFRAIQTNPNLRKLTITNALKEDASDAQGNFYDLEQKLGSILEQSPHVFSQLTHFGLHFIKGHAKAGVDQPLLSFICDHFTSLTHLDLNVSLRFKDLIPQLVKLPHLTSLRLVGRDFRADPDAASREIPPGSEHDHSDMEHFEPSISTNPKRGEYRADYQARYGPDQQLYFFFGLTPRFYKDDLTPLPSIRTLYLAELAIVRWESFDYLKYCFPHLRTLVLEHCPLAQLKRLNNKRFVSRRALLLEKLRQFTKLERVYRNHHLLIEMSKISSKQDEKSLVSGAIRQLFKVPKVPKDLPEL